MDTAQSESDGFMLVMLLPAISASFSVDLSAGLRETFNTVSLSVNPTSGLRGSITSFDGFVSTLSFDSLINDLSLGLDGLTKLITPSFLLSNNKINAGLGFLVVGGTMQRGLGGAAPLIAFLVFGEEK